MPSADVVSLLNPECSYHELFWISYVFQSAMHYGLWHVAPVFCPQSGTCFDAQVDSTKYFHLKYTIWTLNSIIIPINVRKIKFNND